MDPTENLKEQLKIANYVATNFGSIDTEDFEDKALRLSELVLALNEWLSKDGYAPTQWCKERQCNTCGSLDIGVMKE